MALRLLAGSSSSRITSSSVSSPLLLLKHHQQQQLQLGYHHHRGYWQEVIRVKRDRRDGNKLKHEDPERVVKRFQEQRRGSDGEGLLDLHMYNDRHEKPWMKKKRLAEKRRYDFDKNHVMDLAKYIQFVQDNKEK